LTSHAAGGTLSLTPQPAQKFRENQDMTRADDISKLILRLMLGILMLLHGINKIMNGMSGIENMLTAAGLPPWVAYGVFIGEGLAPLLLVLGFYARIGALLIVINMVFAVFLAHGSQLLQLGKTGGWALELQAFYLFTALALLISGPGRFSVNRR